MRFVDGEQVLEVERAHWSERHFDDLGWHDCRVHAIAFAASETDDPFDSTLSLDLDYILGWIPPPDGEVYFKFWVAPTTLVFRGAFHLDGTLHADLEPLELDGISRSPSRHVDGHELDDLWDWTVEGHEFSLGVTAAGFDQYIRAAPTLTGDQYLSVLARGGHSFARTPGW